MSLTPGYDFEINETVTAEKLLAWLVGSSVASSFDAAASGLSANAMGTGPTAYSMAEGTLMFNSSTGHIEVQTRWGHCPLFSGSRMFTRRFKSWYYSTSPTTPYFYGGVALSFDRNGNSKYSCAPAVLEDNWWEFTPAAWARVAVEGQGQFGTNLGGIFYPSLDNPGTGTTEVSLSHEKHRMVMIRGWGPARFTMTSAYTGGRVVFSDLVQDNTGSEIDQYAFYSSIAMRAPAALHATYTNWPGKYMVYLDPGIYSVSLTSPYTRNTRAV